MQNVSNDADLYERLIHLAYDGHLSCHQRIRLVTLVIMVTQVTMETLAAVRLAVQAVTPEAAAVIPSAATISTVVKYRWMARAYIIGGKI